MNVAKAKSEIEDYLINSGESVDEWSVERMAEIVAADYPEAASIDDIDPDDFTGLMEEWGGKVANEVGEPIDFEAACAYMDDELREALGGRDEEVTDVATVRKDAYDAYEWVEANGGLSHVEAKCYLAVEVARLVTGRRSGTSTSDAVLADLRRRLMPEGTQWPRFEDGEPIRIGDEVDGDGAIYRVCEIAFSDVYGTCLRYEDSRDGNSYNFIDGLEPGQRVKRPAPKALDADGAEIREGDTVGATCDLSKLTVTNPNNGKFFSVCCKGEDGEDYRCHPTVLTHRAPVLATDGRPLSEGETVWVTGGRA